MRATRVGWLEGKEVVEVRFDRERLALADLARAAKDAGSADRVWVQDEQDLRAARAIVGERAERLREEPGPAKPSDEKYYLSRSSMRFLPLTPLQATRLNAVLGSASDSGQVLSPRQFLLGERIAARLERDPRAFDELGRPESIEDLPAYAAALESILAAD